MIRNALMAQLAGHPIALDPAADINALFSAAADRIAEIEGRLSDSPLDATSGFWPPAGHWMNIVRPYNVVDGVLHVPVKGLLKSDFPFAAGSYATGYEYIAEAVARGAADRSVHTILLDVNSPGGAVTGCFACADVIHDARKFKRVVASVQDHAHSAAYALASQANEIVVAETGSVGSVGIVTYHIDASGAYEKMGVVKTYIFAGKFKVDGNETEPLSKTAKARTERRLQASYDVFVRTVARGRAMSGDEVRATEALTYTALDGIEVGFADRIGNHIDATSAIPGHHSESEDDTMAEKQATFTQADIDAAVAAATVGAQESAAVARGEGAVAERTRIAAILGSDDAKTRPALATKLAFDLGMDADAAAVILAAAAVEAPVQAEATTSVAAPKGMFDAAMGDGKDGLSAGVPAPASEADLAERDPNAYLAALRARA